MKTVKELLVRSFDEQLLPEEQKKLNEALTQSEELRQEMKEIKELRDLIGGFSPSFEPGFSQAVLVKIEHTEQNSSLSNLFKKFAFGGVAAIIALLVSVYLTDGNLSVDSLLGLSDLSTDNLLLALSTF